MSKILKLEESEWKQKVLGRGLQEVSKKSLEK